MTNRSPKIHDGIRDQTRTSIRGRLAGVVGYNLIRDDQPTG